MTIAEMRRQRSELVAKARQIVDSAKKEGRNLSEAESKSYDSLVDQATDLKVQVEREEKLLAIEKELAESAGTQSGGIETPDGTILSLEDVPLPQGKEYRKAFASFLRRGANGLSSEERSALDRQYKAALQADLDISGGYLVTPLEFVRDLIKALDNEVFIRPRATKRTVVTAQGLGVPSLDADPDDADWTSELKTGSEDSSMALGRREFYPHPLAKRVKISNKLLRLTDDAESLVLERLLYKFGITNEKGFLVGTGNNQPLGIFTASDDGIPTSRDVSTGNTANSITFDGLIEAKYALKAGYWNRATWIFHRDAIKMITKLKDGEGQYIWRESVRAGEPDRLLGIEMAISEYAPNTFTTGKYVGALGDLSYYWIVDALDMQIQRLVELYAETNQTGIIGRMETDGTPVLGEAFSRVKLA